MMIAKGLLMILAGLLIAGLVVGQVGGLRGSAPTDLGVQGGRLKPPSETPNSVSSQADLYPGHPQQADAQIQPLPLRGDGPATLARLQALLPTQPGCQVISSRPDYLYAQCSTRWLKFTDDMEFWFDPTAQVIQVRSASRLGRKDFGVNRARVEALRANLATAP